MPKQPYNARFRFTCGLLNISVFLAKNAQELPYYPVKLVVRRNNQLLSFERTITPFQYRGLLQRLLEEAFLLKPTWKKFAEQDGDEFLLTS